MENRAVVFADVTGSTRLYEVLGNEQALASIGLCLGLLRAATVDHGGRVVKEIGDELLCAFDEATAAARAAMDMQNRVGLQDPVRGEKLAIRVGMHYGPVIEKEEDVFGDCVNVAARMAGLAKGGQIITTRDLVEKLPAELRAVTRSLSTLAVKGKSEDIAVFELMASQTEELTTLATRPSAAPQLRLRLRHREREMLLGAEDKVVTFGRDPASHFQIADRKASREHARIEQRQGKYVLVDRSSNGTYVTFLGQREIALRREEAVLHGAGSFCFGHPYLDDPGEVVTFEVA